MILERKIKSNGFALIIALSLMSFIVLLTLTMSSLLKVNMDASSKMFSQDEARRNAMLGLQVALGDLQDSVGPDQRITAGSEHSGVTTITQGRKQYTGVWDAESANKGVFVKWLVSSPTANGFTNASDVGGSITAGDAEVSLFLGNEQIAGYVTDDEVKVPRVYLPNRSGDNVGSYAYWVGDEGVKAKFNPTLNGLDDVLVRNDNTHLGTSSRYGIEWVDLVKFKDYDEVADPLPNLIRTGVENIISRNQIPIVLDNSEQSTTSLFHNITTYSRGLAVNVRDSGLKEDLSLAFEYEQKDFDTIVGVNDPSLVDEQYVFTIPLADNYIDSITGLPVKVHGPRWDLLQEHYNFHKVLKPHNTVLSPGVSTYPKLKVTAGDKGNLTDPEYYSFMENFAYISNKATLQNTFKLSTTTAPVMVPRMKKATISPVITASMVAISLYADSADRQLKFLINPVFFLWNPYNVELSVEHGVPEGLNFYIPAFAFKSTITVNGVDYVQDTILKIQFNLANRIALDARFGPTIPNEDLIFEPGEIKMFGASRYFRGMGADGSIIKSNGMLGYDPDNGGLYPDTNPLVGKNGVLYSVGDSVVVKLEAQADFRLIMMAESGNVKYNPPTSFPMLYHGRMFHTISDPAAPAADKYVVETPAMSIGGIVQENIPFGVAAYYERIMAADDQDSVAANFGNTKNPVELFTSSNPRAKHLGVRGTALSPKYGSPSNVLNMITTTGSGADLPLFNSNNRGFWGNSFTATGQKSLMCWEFPVEPLTSIAQLQHANTSRMGGDPSYALGNSYASPYIPQDKLWYGTIQQDPGLGSAVHQKTHQSGLDLSYYMNQAIWDKYFFSGIASNPDKDPGVAIDPVTIETAVTAFINNDSDGIKDNVLRNPRTVFYKRVDQTFNDIEDMLTLPGNVDVAATRVAGHVLIDGSFNVNSTSKLAWKAFLGGTNKMNIEYRDPDYANLYTGGTSEGAGHEVDGAAFSRFSMPFSSVNDTAPIAVSPVASPNNNYWSGFRVLSEPELDRFAEEMVKQVKLRGPFVWLEDFVNRELTLADTGLSGAIQSAIDAAELNGRHPLLLGPFVPEGINNASESQLVEKTLATVPEEIYPNPNAGPGVTVGGAPGFLLQGDVLNSIAPYISTRSHTFTIRASGQSINPISGETVEVFLEAVVQQTPDFLYAGDGVGENECYEEFSDLSSINQEFGRKYSIVSFRWLSANER